MKQSSFFERNKVGLGALVVTLLSLLTVVLVQNWQGISFDLRQQAAERQCLKPEAPAAVKARSGTESGTVLFSWLTTLNTDHYAVSYGMSSGKYEYGLVNVGTVRQLLVQYLEPGQKYYFVVAAVNECGSSPFSAEAVAIATGGVGGGGAVAELPPTEKGEEVPIPTIKPTPTPMVKPTPELVAIEEATAVGKLATESGLVVEPKEKAAEKPVAWWSRFLEPPFSYIGVGLALIVLLALLFGRRKKRVPELLASPKPVTPASEVPAEKSPSVETGVKTEIGQEKSAVEPSGEQSTPGGNPPGGVE